MANTSVSAFESSGGIITRTVEPGVPQAIGLRRADHLVRRLQLVWLDLGLDGVTPDGWARATPDGVVFSPLTPRQADRLIRALEALAADYEPESPKPGPGQLRLFGAAF